MHSQSLSRRFALILGLAIGAMAIPAGAQAATRTVCATGCTDTTITAAVAAASAGDVINVSAGTYTEDVNVTKALTINGPKAGQDARTRVVTPAGEAVLNASTGGFTLSADGIVIDGFTFTAGSNDGVQTSSAFSGFQVRNNYFHSNGVGLYLGSKGDVQTVVERNRFDNNNGPSGLQSGIYGDGGIKNVVIRDNKFTGNVNMSLNISGVAAVQNSNITVTRNEADQRFGFLNVTGLVISENDIRSATSNALQIYAGNTNVLVTGNRLHDVLGLGAVRITDTYKTDAAGKLNSGIVVEDNDISNVVNAINVQGVEDPAAGAVTDTVHVHGNRIVKTSGHAVIVTGNGGQVDATFNWFGCNEGAGPDGCETVSGTADATKHLQLNVSVAPAVVQVGGTATVTTSFVPSTGTTSLSGFPGLTAKLSATGGTLPVTATLANGTSQSAFVASTSVGTVAITASADGTFVATAVAVLPKDTDNDGLTDANDCAPNDAKKPAQTGTDANCDGVVDPAPITAKPEPTRPEPTRPAPTKDDDRLVSDDDGGELDGGEGDDLVSGGLGSDVLRGGLGSDRLFGGLGADKLFGGDGNDVTDGGAGNDSISGDAGDDTLIGGTGNDGAKGGTGDDVLRGGAGNDNLEGGTGEDLFDGGVGNDTIDARDRSSDVVRCGSGRDTVRAHRNDLVAKDCEKVIRSK